MSETQVIEQSLPEVLLLPTRGACAVQYYELYDEVAHGADNYHIRCRVKTISELSKIIKDVLACGNPCDISPGTTNFALGRYKKYGPHSTLLEQDAADPYPNKAYFAYKMIIRIKFYSDFGYIELGKKWNPLRLEDGSLNPDYPIEQTKRSNGHRFTLDDTNILTVCMISNDDAKYILNLFKTDGVQAQELTEGVSLDEIKRNAVNDTVNVAGGDSYVLSNFDVEGGDGEITIIRETSADDADQEIVSFDGVESDEQVYAFVYTDHNNEVLFVDDVDTTENPRETIVIEPTITE